MKEFNGKVAVVTGAASGIGLAISRKCLQQGMSVLMTDINARKLTIAVEESQQGNFGHIEMLVADLSRPEDMQALKQAADVHFGSVDLLVNCAGIMINKLSWEMNAEDWALIRATNIDSVAHAIHAFVPDMISRDRPAHIVNVGSVASFLPAPTMSGYCTSKFAIRALTQTLKYELDMLGAPIGVSLLAPGPVKTGIMQPDDSSIAARDDKIGEQTRNQMTDALATYGMEPTDVADLLFDAIVNNRFWVFTHPELLNGMTEDTAQILASINPLYQPASL